MLAITKSACIRRIASKRPSKRLKPKAYSTGWGDNITILPTEQSLKQSVDLIKAAKGIIVTAGAGMSEECGIPRTTESLKNVLPQFKDTEHDLNDFADREWMETNPEQAWGFYGSLLDYYRKTKPSKGHELLLDLCERMPYGYFVVTNLTDGIFQKAGFDSDRIVELNGSLHQMQGFNSDSPIVPAPEELLDIDYRTMRAVNVPKDTDGNPLRPHVTLRNDMSWNSKRTDGQSLRMDKWVSEFTYKDPMIVLELGAQPGSSVRLYSTHLLFYHRNSRMIRIHKEDPKIERGHLGIKLGMTEALSELTTLMDGGEIGENNNKKDVWG